ncbi:MAG: phosphatase [Bacteroidetes bacterium]|nr:phosphatase [Bacteroidota bacterium]
MKFGAVDIGSNGVRLLIARPLQLDILKPEWKKVEFTRLPLRLGDDVFSTKEIGEKKLDLLVKAMKAFALLMDIYNVDFIRACATSAMRDAKNADKIIKLVKKECGITIDVITGSTESKLIMNAFIHLLPTNDTFLHIDVGGGSTELTLIQNNKPLVTRSFNIGTVRARENKVKDDEVQKLHAWVKENVSWVPKLKGVGTGGNIHKLGELANVSVGGFFSVKKLKQLTDDIEQMDQNERVYHLKLNPDRAEVIDIAGRIYLDIFQKTNIDEIMTPYHGLKDGIIQDMWEKYFTKQKD